MKTKEQLLTTCSVEKAKEIIDTADYYIVNLTKNTLPENPSCRHDKKTIRFNEDKTKCVIWCETGCDCLKWVVGTKMALVDLNTTMDKKKEWATEEEVKNE